MGDGGGHPGYEAEGSAKGQKKIENKLLLFIWTANGVLPGDSDTTARHNKQITHNTQNNTPHWKKTEHTMKDTMHTMNKMQIQLQPQQMLLQQELNISTLKLLREQKYSFIVHGSLFFLGQFGYW